MPEPRDSHADLAAAYLTAATEDIKLRTNSYKSPYGLEIHPSHNVDAPERMLLVLAGIGQALMAIREDAACQSGELADVVHSVAGVVGDLQVPADRIADAIERPRRWWQVRRRRAKRRLDQRVRAARDSLASGMAGPWKNGPLLADQHMQERPDAEIRGFDEDAYERAFCGPAGLLTAAELVTVRRALEDAAAWRSGTNDDCDGPRLCAEHARDARLAAEYSAVLARLMSGAVIA